MVDMLAVDNLCFFHSLDCILISFVTFLPPHSDIAESTYISVLRFCSVRREGLINRLNMFTFTQRNAEDQVSSVQSSLEFFFESTIFIVYSTNSINCKVQIRV